jgi:hypothetical protein
MRLKETHNKVRVGKHLSDQTHFLSNGIKQESTTIVSVFYFSLEYAIRKVLEIGRIGVEWKTSASSVPWR